MKKETQTIAIIPSRYASTRFPGKPLAAILGKPMLQRVHEQCCRAALVNRVIIATDDERIASAAKRFEAEVVMTSPHCPSGTDRVASVVERDEYKQYDLIVNVQGDEPLIDPVTIDSCVQVMLRDDTIVMSTAKSCLDEPKELLDPNVVKVVTDNRGAALYFSRSPIPFHREAWGKIFLSSETGEKNLEFKNVFKHIGLYVYRRDFLLKFTKLPRTPLEKIENLEQLRALEHGFSIGVVLTESKSYGVDVPEDIARVERILAGEKEWKC